MTRAAGPLAKLRIALGEPVVYSALVGEAEMSLANAVGLGLEIRFLGRISCCYCGADSPRSYGGGYCYRCFRALARCDVCVVSPDRCHYAAGTCREPEWGEAFCMRPHVVYLANSSGAKVGITGAGNELRRWLDQGARQGLIVLAAATRHKAGLVEAQLAQLVADRTDWRLLLSRDVEAIDLPMLRDALRRDLAARLLAKGVELPDGVIWQNHQPHEFRYPVQRYGHRLAALRLDERDVIRGNLLGIKGQYLLFDHGVFNVRQHTSYHVRLTLMSEPLDPGAGDDHQMELFS